jgi:hypothetical protein
MKRIRRVLIIALLSLSIFAYWSYRQHAAVVEAAEFMPVAPELHPIPAGTEIQAVLSNRIIAGTKRGDRILAFIASPVVVDNVQVLPSGIQLEGTIDGIEKHARRAHVMLHFTDFIFNGATSPIEADPVAVTAPVTSDINTLMSALNAVLSTGIGVAIGSASQSRKGVAAGLVSGAIRGVPAPTRESPQVTLVLTAPLRIQT